MPQDVIEIVKGFFSRSNPCEKLIRYYGSNVQISVSGGMMGATLDLKNISRQVQEIASATECAKILDDYQYLLCKEIVNSNSNVRFRELLRKYRIIVVTYITHIGLIMKQIQDGLNNKTNNHVFIDGLKEKLIQIIQKMQDLISKIEKTLLEE